MDGADKVSNGRRRRLFANAPPVARMNQLT